MDMIISPPRAIRVRGKRKRRQADVDATARALKWHAAAAEEEEQRCQKATFLYSRTPGDANPLPAHEQLLADAHFARRAGPLWTCADMREHAEEALRVRAPCEPGPRATRRTRAASKRRERVKLF